MPIPDKDLRDVIGRGMAFPIDVSYGRIKWSVPGDKTPTTAEYADAIRQRIQFLVLTIAGQRPLYREYGSTISEHLFSLLQPALAAVILQRILTALGRWEPRVTIVDATYDLMHESGTVAFLLTWRLNRSGFVGSSTIPIGLEFKEAVPHG